MQKLLINALKTTKSPTKLANFTQLTLILTNLALFHINIILSVEQIPLNLQLLHLNPLRNHITFQFFVPNQSSPSLQTFIFISPKNH